MLVAFTLDIVHNVFLAIYIHILYSATDYSSFSRAMDDWNCERLQSSL